MNTYEIIIVAILVLIVLLTIQHAYDRNMRKQLVLEFNEKLETINNNHKEVMEKERNAGFVEGRRAKSPTKVNIPKCHSGFLNKHMLYYEKFAKLMPEFIEVLNIDIISTSSYVITMKSNNVNYSLNVNVGYINDPIYIINRLSNHLSSLMIDKALGSITE